MTVRWDIFRYYCPKCFNAFLPETKNKEYNGEIKCPKCGFILRKKKQKGYHPPKN